MTAGMSSNKQYQSVLRKMTIKSWGGSVSGQVSQHSVTE